MIPVTTILRQETGRFDRRFRVGPVTWDFWDLLWLHEERLTLKLGTDATKLELRAPSGVLIPPGTHFRGSAVGGAAIASVTHFTSTRKSKKVLLVPESDRMHVTNLMQLSLECARRNEPMDRRIRLLTTILDCFADTDSQPQDPETRLDRAWREAAIRLSEVRSVSDVAVFAGLAESTFRSAHRNQFGSPAGKHLQQLRLSEAERYLATTGFGLTEIAALVGYAHPETLSAAFKRSRARTPGEFRRWCKRFA
jgi:AraC-like DNA-binding protein